VNADASVHLTPKRAATALALGLALAACGSVSVRPSRSGVTASPRPAGCQVEFLRTTPDRGFDEIAEVYSYYSWVAEPEDVLREKACELGADAVLVTRDFLVSTGRGGDHKLISGFAIKYRDHS